MVWSCQASHPRIRGRSEAVTEKKSLPHSSTATSSNNDSTKRSHTQRDLSTTTSNTTTCSAVSVDGFPSCAAFCEQQTGYSLNTFIELDHGETGTQYCCACFSGEAYCSDDIPECTDYVNLDFSGLSIKWNNAEGKKDEDPEVDSSGKLNITMGVSCMDINVTNSLACVDFCEAESGDSSYEYRGNAGLEKFYCVCSSTLNTNGTVSYCQDNMSERWMEALSNSTILPLSTRMGVLP
ncbi:hypothetical protein IV203_009625 [Nitzschia inconspicua]|uniref:Uncharacterized protein n=1 Tax=Nitzschia inconspicua TaxID=303405 RepID=A0A9K3KW40_9STRA|nr:hypothetical protein IV203_009625 [Nitzschia inconspicua]